MSRAVVVRYRTESIDRAEENQRLVQNVFAQLTADAPDGLRYATLRLDDGVSFVHIAIREGDADVLPQLRAFKEFRKGLGDRLDGPPIVAEATMIGAYRFAGLARGLVDRPGR